MIAGFASVLGKQARGTVLLEATQQTKHLTPLQADQHTGVSDTQATRLNPQQHLKTAELLLAHRQHRHGAPPGTPEPGGVSSLYCAYTTKSQNSRFWKIPLPGSLERFQPLFKLLLFHDDQSVLAESHR